jgi:hypothetical protein
MGTTHKGNRNGQRSVRERPPNHAGYILDRIRGTFHNVTVTFTRCFIRIRGLALKWWTPPLWTSDRCQK